MPGWKGAMGNLPYMPFVSYVQKHTIQRIRHLHYMITERVSDGTLSVGVGQARLKRLLEYARRELELTDRVITFNDVWGMAGPDCRTAPV